jgi:hypothetical protein
LVLVVAALHLWLLQVELLQNLEILKYIHLQVQGLLKLLAQDPQQDLKQLITWLLQVVVAVLLVQTTKVVAEVEQVVLENHLELLLVVIQDLH